MRLLALPTALLFAAALNAVAADPAPPSNTDQPPQNAAEGAAASTDSPAAPAVTDPAIFERLTIVGSSDQVSDIPGSAHYLSKADLERHDYSDIHQIVRTIPGVIVQDEEGFGLRPNIGMRGTGVERSQKITLMEDGVLIAPAPYTAPAAYYFPTAGRMESVEVRKGSSAVVQGPYTTGGAMNLISSSIPSDFGGQFEAYAGEHGTGRVHAIVGDSRERFGWMIETFQFQTDGFKELDGGGDTGVLLQDYVGKFRINSSSSSRIQQALELKIGYVTQEGDETYLGLTESDYHSNPFRRYAGSQEDVIDTEHEQAQIRHFIAPAANWDVTTTVYRNDFFRNWYKLGSVGGASIANVLNDPDRYASQLAILRGETDDSTGALSLRNNRRDYFSQGIQSVAGIRANSGTFGNHEIEIGVRYHEDGEDRFQEDDRWGIQNGDMFLVSRGTPGSNANRVAEAEAIAVFVQDRITLGRLQLTPGVRFESIDFTRVDYARGDTDRTGNGATIRENGVDVVVPGIGAMYSVTPQFSVFGGVHRGFAPPGPGSHVDTDAEESVNYETGFRFDSNPVAVQLVGFYNDYSNLLGRDTLSSGGEGTGDLYNGGEAEVLGLEASLDSDLGRFVSSRFAVPVRFAYTFTEATFLSSFETSFADWGPAVQEGDRLPYVPENQWSLGVGLVANRWSTHANLSYADEMRTSAGQGPIPANEGTDDYLLLDLGAEYRLFAPLRLVAQLRNATDETYVAARRPAGLRPGMPRTMMLGVRWDF